jgi:3-phenylpropionate/cinnamic acid dioxygenase small subunit
MNDARGDIENLLYRYAELIDAGDYEGIGELFAHGSIADEAGNPMATGAEAVAKLYHATTRKYDDGTPRTQHILTNPLVEFGADGSTAECRSRFTVLQQTDLLPLQPIISGAYVDHFEKVDGTWRYTEKRMCMRLFGDLSQHLLIEVGPA